MRRTYITECLSSKFFPKMIQKVFHYTGHRSMIIRRNKYKCIGPCHTVTIIEDPKRTVPYGEKIYMKYLGTLDHPVPKMILDSAKKGNYVVLEISQFFSTWDFP